MAQVVINCISLCLYMLVFLSETSPLYSASSHYLLNISTLSISGHAISTSPLSTWLSRSVYCMSVCMSKGEVAESKKVKTAYLSDKGPVLEMPHAEVINLHKAAYFKVGRLLFHWHLSASLPPITSISLGCLLSINQSVSQPVCLSFHLTLSLILSVFQSFSSTLPPTLSHIYILIHTPPPLLFLRGADWSGSGLVYVHELSDTVFAAALHHTGTTTARYPHCRGDRSKTQAKCMSQYMHAQIGNHVSKCILSHIPVCVGVYYRLPPHRLYVHQAV